jgi:hypothetical protein
LWHLVEHREVVGHVCAIAGVGDRRCCRRPALRVELRLIQATGGQAKSSRRGNTERMRRTRMRHRGVSSSGGHVSAETLHCLMWMPILMISLTYSHRLVVGPTRHTWGCVLGEFYGVQNIPINYTSFGELFDYKTNVLNSCFSNMIASNLLTEGDPKFMLECQQLLD